MTDNIGDRATNESFLVITMHFLESVNKTVGNIVCWLALGCALTCFLVVVLRYAFDIGTIWLQELYVWQHAFLFILGAGPAFANNEHVRVDLITEKRSLRTRAIFEALGILFLLIPFLVFLAFTSWPFVALSWTIGETTGQSGGLSGVYWLKGSLLVFVFLLALQGIASFIRSFLIITNHPIASTRFATQDE